MYICICHAVTDREIEACVRDGASTLSDVSARLGVATCCGCCAASAARIIHDALNQALDARAGDASPLEAPTTA